MAQTRRTFTVTPNGARGFKVNYTVAGFSPDSPDETKHKEFTRFTDVERFVEQLKKVGYSEY